MTDRYQITSASAWVALAAAPAIITNIGAFSVLVQVEPTLPAGDDSGHLLRPGETLMLDAVGTLYARLNDRMLTPGDIIVTPLAAQSTAYGRSKTEPLGTWVTAQTTTAGAATSSVTLGSTTRRISMTARNADVYFRIGTGTVNATAGNGSGFLPAGATKDFAVPAGAKVAVIRAGSTDAIVEIDELGEP